MLPPDSIHKAMVNAAWSKDSESNCVNVTSKVKVSSKAKAELICKRNNTTISAFLRECVETICREYDGDHTKAQE